MATGTRTTDTFTEGLRKVLGDIQDLKTTDDADLPYIINLETMILQRLKQQGSDALNGTSPMAAGPGAMMAPGMGPMPPPGMGPPGMPPPGMPPGMPPPGMAGPPGVGPPGLAPAPVPGLMAGPNIPNIGELKRVLGSGTTALRLGNVADRLAKQS
jgi:hypothetical protein